MNRSLRSLSCLTAAAALSPLAQAQETLEQRLDRIERENRELRQRVDALAPARTPAPSTAGSSASAPDATGFRKVYAIDSGVSIAGYGETLFTQRSGLTDVADALRTVLYFGYRFDDQWLFHSEIEVEHGTTSDSSGTTTSGGEVSLEFGYLEFAASDTLSIRSGVVLVPVGLVNEQHEPTLFLPAARAQTESRIVPTTWRELGIEAIERFGDFEAKLFVGTGLDGEEFGASGLRGGRQKGNRAAADDIATAIRLDYRHNQALTVGGSAFYQKAGQDGTRGTTAIPELDTLIVEAHADWRPGDWTLRALYASAFCDDAAAFAAATSRNLAERLYGGYAEIGYDVAPALFPTSRIVLVPFFRYEHIDTQADMPPGIAANTADDSQIWTFGVNVRPTHQIVFKLDFEAWDDTFDRMNISMGYVF